MGRWGWSMDMCRGAFCTLRHAHRSRSEGEGDDGHGGSSGGRKSGGTLIGGSISGTVTIAIDWVNWLWLWLWDGEVNHVDHGSSVPLTLGLVLGDSDAASHVVLGLVLELDETVAHWLGGSHFESLPVEARSTAAVVDDGLALEVPDLLVRELWLGDVVLVEPKIEGDIVLEAINVGHVVLLDDGVDALGASVAGSGHDDGLLELDLSGGLLAIVADGGLLNDASELNAKGSRELVVGVGVLPLGEPHAGQVDGDLATTLSIGGSSDSSIKTIISWGWWVAVLIEV